MARHFTPSLERRKAVRDPKRRFTIICEGENTEPAYFTALQAAFPDVRIEIDPAAGTPMTIANRAAKLAKQRGKEVDSFAKNDEIWAVFDRDLHPNHAEAVGLCDAKHVGVARSNPCFEVWLILHFTEFERPDDRHAVQRHFETLCPDYDKNKGKRPDCGRFIDKLEEAERWAERQLFRRDAEGNPYGAPSTTVFRLTQAIKHAADLARDPNAGKKK